MLRLKPVQPASDQLLQARQIQMLMFARIFVQIGLRQLEQRRRRAKPVFLQMHKCARELDKSLVKISIRSVALRQPKIFQNVVGLVKFLTVEQFKIAAVMRIQIPVTELPDHGGYAFALAAHA